MVYIPDDSDFSSFREQCESLEGWHCRYNKAGVTVWSHGQEESCTVQKIKVSPPLRTPLSHQRPAAARPKQQGLGGLDPKALLQLARCSMGSLPAPCSRHLDQDAAAVWKHAQGTPMCAHLAAALAPDTGGNNLVEMALLGAPRA